jgi:hypothetical protein
MNKAKRNFWLDIMLLALFIVTAVSLLGHHSAGGIIVHSIAGALMILGSLVHIVWHWDWIKANILRSPRAPGRAQPPSGKTTRASRRIDLLLIVLFALCGVSGLLGQVMALAPVTQPHAFLLREGLSHLHSLSGALMLLLIVPHVRHHAKWLACMARKCFAPAKPMQPAIDSEVLNQ